MKRLFYVIICLVMLISFSGCGFSDAYTEMPFNGDIVFHDMSLTIPVEFVRDSTQSSEDFWIFESGSYSEYIILSRSDIDKDETDTFNNYCSFITGQGGEASLGSFKGNEGVLCYYIKDDMYCQELMFSYNGSIYNITVRDGEEGRFTAITDSVKLIENEDVTESATMGE